ncbi:MAG: metal-dependent hydrolase [Bacteroidales bacterium]|jgi:hypothetical protein|nr:metal-dependent hydrolase [Bacteroidales bacterium]
MDILTHIISGVAASSVVAASTKSKIPAPRILAVGALGGAFPDIDAISLWSKFDSTIGKWFGLTHTGKEIYFGKFWYSHHGFFHSIAAAIMIGFLLGCLAYLYHWLQWQRQRDPFTRFFKTNSTLYLIFVLGCLAHVAGDLITPASVWGGVRLFCPHAGYAGGQGSVWWWNNYDIFLIIATGTLLNILLIVVAKHIRFRTGVISFLVALLILAGVWRQAAARQTDYAYTGHTGQYQQLEQKSRKEQQRILGPKLYRIMERFDNWLIINF